MSSTGPHTGSDPSCDAPRERSGPGHGADVGIRAVGVDLCCVDRMAQALERTPGLLDRICTPAERERPELGDPAGRALAAAQLFAFKEAVMKSLGAGFDTVPFDSVELVAGAGPWPEGSSVQLHGVASDLATGAGLERVEAQFRLLQQRGRPTVLVTVTA
ncbi:MAG: 4'-phosphopantetheinyl transferase superfamily protein [Microthrixaceae bacterium]